MTFVMRTIEKGDINDMAAHVKDMTQGKPLAWIGADIILVPSYYYVISKVNR